MRAGSKANTAVKRRRQTGVETPKRVKRCKLCNGPVSAAADHKENAEVNAIDTLAGSLAGLTITF